MTRVLAFALACFLVLTGCMSATEYDSALLGGVDSERIGDGLYKITAQGNRYTTQRTAEEFAILKAAETAKEAGRGGFLITDASIRAKQTVYQGGSTQPHSANIEMTIELLDGPPGNRPGGKYFDAAEVIETLGSKHLPR